MKHLLNCLTTLSTKYARLTLLVGLSLALLSLWHAFAHLAFDTDQDHLISEKQAYYQDYKSFLTEFGDWEYIYVVIKPESTVQGRVQAKTFADELHKKLAAEKNLFLEITHKIDVTTLKHNLLLLSSAAEFSDFITFGRNNSEMLAQFLAVQSSADWYAFINKLFEQNPTHDHEAQLEKFWPFLQQSLTAPFEKNTVQNLQNTNMLSLFSEQTLDPDGYLFSENGKLLFMKILPVKDFSRMDIIAEPLKTLRSQIDLLKQNFPNMDVGITGRPVLQNDEAASTQTDSEWAGLASFLLVAGLIFIFYREFKKPLFALVALCFGIAWTTGFVSLVFGSVNLITIVFAIILIGLGIDYTIHFLSRLLRDAESSGHPVIALSNTMQHTGRAIFLGAITSATAFATAVFTDFLGLQQLGIIAGVGILFCCFSALTIFPCLIYLFDKKMAYLKSHTPSNQNEKKYFVYDSARKLLLRHPKIILTVFALGLLFSLPCALKVSFDNNLLKLQDQNLESVRYEKVIQDNTEFSTWFLAFQTRDLTELKAVQQKINQLSTVKSTQSLLNLIPDMQNERIKTISELATGLTTTKSAHATNTTTQALKTLIGHFDSLASKAFSSGFAEEFAELNHMKEILETKLTELNTSQKIIPPFEKEFQKFVLSTQKLLQDMLAPTGLTQDNLPPRLLSLFKGKNNFYSLTIYPKNNIWDPEHMEKFITDVRTVIPAVTGAPVTTFESAKKMSFGFTLVALLTSILVLLFVFMEFKNASIPLVIYGNLCLSFVFLGAFMSFKGLNINLANFFALPVLIGTGIDHGIHIFHQYKENQSLDSLFDSTIPAIIMSCLTTICGFASLAFVRHNGLASFGLIMAVGTLIILINSIVLLPAFITVFSKK